MYEHATDKYKIRQYGENPIQGPEDLQATINFVKSFNEPINYAAEGRISEDTLAPILQDAMLPAADFMDGSYLHEVKVELQASDDGIRVSNIQYSLDNGVTWKRYEDGITLNQDGRNIVQYRASDKAHNLSETKTIEVVIKSATIDNTIQLVEDADGIKGIKRSIIAQLEQVKKTFEKGERSKAYHSLEKIKERISKFSPKHLSERDKNEITLMITYIIEYRTESKE